MILKIATYITALATILGVVIKTWLAVKSVTEGQKCLLRSNITEIYYRYKDREQIPQYAKENCLLMYEAYKALGGNSFVADLIEEIRKWEVVR